ncbi:hypothetical protein OS493_026441 [Desmophyllum pertusum]|uniref:Reverse transcriptase domain-containing protein n=1 Tax=Desmophyllum pertusum TaxID=174260 RepID=A0A9W9YXM3_9CNID|nr:hypothetical protein OS493_026441 [Desmophyllum pertusum]
MVIFLDDGLGGGANKIQAKINSLTVNADLLKFGFVVNEEKSLWEPVQVITWLGVVLDTNQGFISVTEQRISKLKVGIDSILKGDYTIVKGKPVAWLTDNVNVVSIVHADVFQEGLWKEAATFKDPDLQSLSSRLQTSILSARAPGTVNMYDRAFKRWKDFALSKHELSYFPANPIHVAVYLQHVSVESVESTRDHLSKSLRGIVPDPSIYGTHPLL